MPDWILSGFDNKMSKLPFSPKSHIPEWWMSWKSSSHSPAPSTPTALLSLWSLPPDKRQTSSFFHKCQFTQEGEFKHAQSISTPGLTHPKLHTHNQGLTSFLLHCYSLFRTLCAMPPLQYKKKKKKKTTLLLSPPITFKGSATLKTNLTHMLTKLFMRTMGRHGSTCVRTMKRLESNLHIL